MKLAEIKEEKYHLKLDLRYATKNNFTKKKIYQKPVAFLQKEAAIKLKKSVNLAKEMKLKIKSLIRDVPEVMEIDADTDTTVTEIAECVADARNLPNTTNLEIYIDEPGTKWDDLEGMVTIE